MVDWTTPTSPATGDVFSISGRWDPQVKNNLLFLHDLAVYPGATNGSGGALVQGDVVVFHATTAGTVLTTTTVGDTRAGGVVLPSAGIANPGTGDVAVLGRIAVVKVTGTVAIGDYLQTSATAGRAQAGSTGAFAQALSANPAGTGTVTARLLASPALAAHGHTAAGDGGVLASPKVTTSLLDTNGNEWLAASATAAAVNHPQAVNAATGTAPGFIAAGDDASASLGLEGKGTNGQILLKDVPLRAVTVTTTTTAGPVTLTAAQVLGGVLLRDPNGGDRTDTLPTAALLVAAVQGAVVNLAIDLDIRNTADAAETLTLAAGAGGTTSGTMTIVQNQTRRFRLVLTNVTGGTEAYTVYSVFAGTH